MVFKVVAPCEVSATTEVNATTGATTINTRLATNIPSNQNTQVNTISERVEKVRSIRDLARMET